MDGVSAASQLSKKIFGAIIIPIFGVASVLVDFEGDGVVGIALEGERTALLASAIVD